MPENFEPERYELREAPAIGTATALCLHHAKQEVALAAGARRASSRLPTIRPEQHNLRFGHAQLLVGRAVLACELFTGAGLWR